MKICSFCEEEKLPSEVVKGKEGTICNHCTQSATAYFSDTQTNKKPEPTQSSRTLTELKEALDKKVIGQEVAKRQLLVELYKHSKRSRKSKNNVFLIGDSGVGKTHLVRSAAQVFDMPLIEFDATTFSETGYKGKDVSEIIEQAYQFCEGDQDRLMRSILFIDEIDKITKSSSVNGTNMIQQSLLKMIEGTTVTFKARDDRGRRESILIDTTQLQFVVAGACVGLKEQINSKRSNNQGIGFGARAHQKSEIRDVPVGADDLIEYGFIPEFVGRFPLIIELSSLTKEDYVRILIDSEDSVINDYIAMFHEENIDLVVSKDAVEMLAEQIQSTVLGFRSVKSTLTRRLNDLLYDSVELRQDKIVLDQNNLIIDDNYKCK